ncbi:MAG: flagellin [Halomonas sp.]|nr:flagellin [Halomonas sp.]MDP3535938.1 flagellin [Halomonas sp.]
MAIINTNLTSLVSQQNLGKSKSALATSMERLSSGLRVNSAKDDAAGQAISNRFQSQRTGAAMAARNANDGLSMARTAEGALEAVNNKLQRIRELTVQGENGTLNQKDRDAIQTEINLNLQEIDRINQEATFNGRSLLNGESGQVALQVGANDNQTLDLDLSRVFSVESLGLEEYNISGIKAELAPVDTLFNRSQNIILADSGTTQTFTRSGAEMPDGTKLMRIGTGGSYFVQSTEPSGNIIHYRADKEAVSTTFTRTSEVNVTADSSYFYRETTTATGAPLSGGTAISYRNEANAPLTAANSQLVQGNDGDYYLRREESVIGADGEARDETFYYRATITQERISQSSDATGTRIEVRIDDDSARLTALDYTEVTDVRTLPSNTASFVFDDGSDVPGSSRLVQEQAGDGRYFVEVDDAAGGVLFYEIAKITAQLGDTDTDDAPAQIRLVEAPRLLTTRAFSEMLIDENAAPFDEYDSIEEVYLNIAGDAFSSASLVQDDDSGETFIRVEPVSEDAYFVRAEYENRLVIDLEGTQDFTVDAFALIDEDGNSIDLTGFDPSQTFADAETLANALNSVAGLEVSHDSGSLVIQQATPTGSVRVDGNFTLNINSGGSLEIDNSKLIRVAQATDDIQRYSVDAPLGGQSEVLETPLFNDGDDVFFDGATVPESRTLVQGDDGRYYLRLENSAPDKDMFAPVTLTASYVQNDDGTVEKRLEATSIGPERSRAKFDSVSDKNTLDDRTLAGAQTITNPIPDSELTVDQSGRYHLRSLTDATAEFQQARVITTIQSNGEYSLIYEQSGSVRRLDDVLMVDGSSIVALDPATPPNVEVNYVEISGRVSQNVLGRDENGNYIMRISEQGSNDYKTATLVEIIEMEGDMISTDGNYLVRTLNGSGEVVIYYALNLNDHVVEADNDYFTQVIITETGGEIRIKRPDDPLAAVDRAMAQVDQQRSLLGAVQNRLESVVQQQLTLERTTAAAQSRIMDADYAVEVANMTRAQILQQAGTTVLAQANQVPQNVLSLLG